MTKEIELTRGLVTLVDDEDFEDWGGRKWHAQPVGDRFYARRLEQRRNVVTFLLLHRCILRCPPGMVGDHINRDTLDNRRANLRSVPSALNAMNRVRNHTASKSGFKGVSWDQKSWRAELKFGGGRRKGPRRATAEEAARDYDAMVRALVGQHGRYNFPLPNELPALL